MDPITHCLVGGLVAKTAKAHRKRFWILMFLGEAPDLDVFFGGLGSWAFWLQHRGITHSIFGVGIQAAFYTWAFSKWDPGSFHRRLTLYTIPLVLHMLCDFLTSYGIPFLSPFDFREFAADLVPAVTAIPLVFLAFGLYRLHKNGGQGWRATKWLWGAWGIYLIFSLSSRAMARTLVGPGELRATLVSGLGNPFRWTEVIESSPCCAYDAYSIDVLRRKKTAMLAVGTSMEDPAVRASLRSPEAKRFVDNTRWPVARVSASPEGGWIVEWGKMIFSSRGVVRANVRVVIGKDESILKEEKIYGFWSPNEQK